MMATQYVIGVPAAAAVFVAAMNFVGDAIDPGTGITIHSLTFVNDPGPAIVQSRTVSAQNAIFAGWEAKISVGGKAICEGSGSWSYPAGTKAPVIDVDEWVGDVGCWDRLPVGVTMQACSEYKWGDGERTDACTLGFKKE